jgi:hypothetical protein
MSTTLTFVVQPVLIHELELLREALQLKTGLVTTRSQFYRALMLRGAVEVARQNELPLILDGVDKQISDRPLRWQETSTNTKV